MRQWLDQPFGDGANQDISLVDVRTEAGVIAGTHLTRRVTGRCNDLIYASSHAVWVPLTLPHISRRFGDDATRIGEPTNRRLEQDPITALPGPRARNPKGQATP